MDISPAQIYCANLNFAVFLLPSFDVTYFLNKRYIFLTLIFSYAIILFLYFFVFYFPSVYLSLSLSILYFLFLLLSLFLFVFYYLLCLSSISPLWLSLFILSSNIWGHLMQFSELFFGFCEMECCSPRVKKFIIVYNPNLKKKKKKKKKNLKKKKKKFY